MLAGNDLSALDRILHAGNFIDAFKSRGYIFHVGVNVLDDFTAV